MGLFVVKKWFLKKLNILQISRKTNIDKTSKILIPCDIRDDVSIGKYTYISPGSHIFNGTTIGNYCSIGYNVSIAPFEHPSYFLSTSPHIYRDHAIECKLRWPKNDVVKQTTIGNDVWIGSNVVVKQGIHISDGAIIAAGAVVTHDVPPYEIWCGVPAKCLRKRFSQEIIDNLVKSDWWNKEPEKAVIIVDKIAIRYNIYEKVGDDIK